MNPILADMYSTVIPSAPYLIAAYALVWLALMAYVIIVARGLRRAEAQIALLEEELQRKSDGQAESGTASSRP